MSQPPIPAADPAALYRKDVDGALWGDVQTAGWHWRPAGLGRLELVGDCLRCGHPLGAVVNTFVAAAAVPGPTPAGSPTPVPAAADFSQVLPSTIVCECGERHRGRPADAAFQGCGAVFRGVERLEVRP
jgi:hypothetical protein